MPACSSGRRASTGLLSNTPPATLSVRPIKVKRVLAAIESAPPSVSAMPDVGQISLACLLGYRDFRFDGSWREKHPRLHAWHDEFAAAMPALAGTTPHD